MFGNTLEILFLWMLRALVHMSTGLGRFGSTSDRHLLWLQHFLQYFYLLIKRWMTSWIQTKFLCRLFEMIYSRWHWLTKWEHHGGPFPLLWRFHSHSLSAIGGRVWYGMLTLKPTPNHWLMNGSVPWDSALAPLQLLAFLTANDALC